MLPNNKKFGLIGKDISYSFSKKYFTEKFSQDQYENYNYENFDIPNIEEFPNILKNNPNLKGLNVTIPYKEAIIPFLDTVSDKAYKIGAVNIIRVTKNGNLKGYNSDWYGFKKSLKPLLKPHHQKALILGQGGAAKAVAFALKKLNIEFKFVTRKENKSSIIYNQLDASAFINYQIVINCTPLGTSPNTEEFPQIPYNYFTDKHIAFDLIYNPKETQFLSKAKEFGATIINGEEMLIFQAEKAWNIWNK